MMYVHKLIRMQFFVIVEDHNSIGQGGGDLLNNVQNGREDLGKSQCKTINMKRHFGEVGNY